MKLSHFARLACLLIAMIMLAACQRHDEAAPWQLTDISGHMPDLSFRLTDDQGKHVTAADYRGKVTLLYFGYTHCPDVCPLTLEMIADTMDKLGAKASRVKPVFVTVDPARDTPSVMKQYVSAFGKTFVGLTGSDTQIAQMTQEFHVYAKRRPVKGGDYAMDHSGAIYLLDPEGKFAGTYEEVQGPEKIAADLRSRL